MNLHTYAKRILPLVCALFFFSCHYLNESPNDLLTEGMLWQTRINAESYLYNIYGYVHVTDGGDYASMGCSDESSVSISTVNARLMDAGSWNATDGKFYEWGSYYAGIRQSFVFEQNIMSVPATQMSDSLKIQDLAQARFLRGWFYWQILKQYGPFVILSGTISQDATNFDTYSRSPFDTCVAYINQIMDSASAHLPVTWPNSSDYGRPTVGACLAVEAQAALLAASPLWNGNPEFSTLKNKDGTPLATTQASTTRWQTAAAAAKAVINLGAYQLFTNLDEGQSTFNPYASCADLFNVTWSNENIFTNNNWNTWGWVKCSSPGPGGYGMYNPTQNVVDAFCMNNGRTIDDPASGYVETGFAATNGVNAWEQKAGQWNMYANREPRFYAYIQYNAEPVLPAPDVDDKNYFSSTQNQDGTGRAEYYYSGLGGQLANGSNTITGYGISKRVSGADNIRLGTVSYRPYILIRYAEILLDYVEALNEYDPGNPDIVTYLDQIRTRAGLPGIETVYPAAVGDQSLMRTYILREREVELCFEGDRYYTLVRRLMLGEPQYQTIYGMNTQTNDNGQGFAFTGFYTRTLFWNRYWNDRMYLFPIYTNDLETDLNLVQNPGW
jgi:hypothetical protein